MKTCRICKKTKARSAFRVNSSSCKKCQSAECPICGKMFSPKTLESNSGVCWICKEEKTYGPALVLHKVPCRNGCDKTIDVYTLPGETPSKYKYCEPCEEFGSPEEREPIGLSHMRYNEEYDARPWNKMIL